VSVKWSELVNHVIDNGFINGYSDGVMKVATTFQITPEEDKEINRLKKELGLPSKKAVILEGLRALQDLRREQKRRQRLQTASRLVGQGSLQVNREWASRASALKTS
jgi:hypothetical protein